jgi:branched-chain amino acid transport system substrate-binding protein
MHLPQSGPVGVLLGNAWKGAQAYFDEVNAAGGVNGRRVKMIVADDGYSADKAAGAIRELVDTKKVFAASCLAGVDQCVVGLDYANAKAVPYVCAGMSEAAVANRPWAFPDTTSYAYAGSRLVDYLFTKRGFTPQRKIGALYLNSVHISEAVDRMSDRLKSFGARFVVKVPAEKDQSDFSTGITKLANAGVDTLWWFVDPSLIAKFTAQAKLLRYTPQYVFFAPAGGDLFAEATGGNLDGAYGLSGWADPQWPGGAAFRETFKRSYPDQEPTDFTVVAYIHARLLVEGLRRAGPDLGRDAFARGLAGLDRLDTGISSPISYSTRSRLTAANGALALFEIHGTHTDQVTGFDF